MADAHGQLSEKLTHGCLIGQGQDVTYQPKFTITAVLLARVEQIAALRERIQSATTHADGGLILSKTARLNHAGIWSVFISSLCPSVISASQVCWWSVVSVELSKM